MKPQRGMALITVLVVVAVVTVVCAGIIARQQLAIRSTANQLQVRQAWHYALGGEILAKAILRRDLQQGDPRAPRDYLGEPWAQLRAPFTLDKGTLHVEIADASGRFNLNRLADAGTAGEAARGQFRRLLAILQIDTVYAERLTDWLDEDSDPLGGAGAEDDQYLLAQPAYRAANRLLTDVSELRLLGMSAPDYQRLHAFVSALPVEAPLNVNTASAPVIASLAEGLALADATALVEARGAQGFNDVQAFLGRLPAAGISASGLAVGSMHFEVTTEVRIGERRQVLHSQLQRTTEGEVYVLARDLGRSGLPAPDKEALP
ncbi:MAG: type II secretion system minor pseudopilin GspK [Gammaproteobacteria bacterium]|nr:type II secretion system minor pseudopilin GspK [Gammaproteobacteria bacterium]MBU1491366.1 type II secretion system minor pseudopilin GspK [Gammaproteobacteria bacterium]MBU2064605.1 type II secretion system minor pseudopilin GspK [Gammaproteobacteria bacterium]MBU2138603.1 type II secretion system minor pseudopilin GspK [Gammaproteobacteria bacterium]MBU2217048.1 type II secretion system minor pseudopilin GspK [Gammaproteobacteria bacterium]